MLYFIILFLVSGFSGFDAEHCHDYLLKNYISDEQEYIAAFNENDMAFFYATFYKNTTYRIVACSKTYEKVEISLYDKYNNLIFSSKDLNFPGYWDFYFENTMECKIKLEKGEKVQREIHGIAILLIGFKK